MNKPRKSTFIFLISAFAFLAGIPAFAQESAPAGAPEFEYKAGNLRDPFKLFKAETKEAPAGEVAGAPEVPLPSLIVTGIITGGVFPQAIINYKIVKIGDIIEGARIVEIEKEGVTVLFNNRSHELPSPASVIRERIFEKKESSKDRGKSLEPVS